MTTVEIRVKGCLDEHWSSWFGDLAIQVTGQDETILRGEVADQAALYGILARLRNLGLPLVSVNPSDADTGAPPG